MRSILAALCAAAVISGAFTACTKHHPLERKLKRGMGVLRMACNSLGISDGAGFMVRETGAETDPGAVVKLYYDALPAGKASAYPHAVASRSELEPATLLVRAGAKPGEMVIEAYADDLKSPLFVEEIPVKGPKNRVAP